MTLTTQTRLRGTTALRRRVVPVLGGGSRGTRNGEAVRAAVQRGRAEIESVYEGASRRNT